ncbi:16715_t:CDS:1, partial [Acaulospora colombiana]
MRSTEDWHQTAVVNYGLNSIPFEEFDKEKKEVGRGGSGVIYSSIWIPTSEQVALKQISVNQEKEETVRNFLKE